MGRNFLIFAWSLFSSCCSVLLLLPNDPQLSLIYDFDCTSAFLFLSFIFSLLSFIFSSSLFASLMPLMSDLYFFEETSRRLQGLSLCAQFQGRDEHRVIVWFCKFPWFSFFPFVLHLLILIPDKKKWSMTFVTLLSLHFALFFFMWLKRLIVSSLPLFPCSSYSCFFLSLLFLITNDSRDSWLLKPC